MSRYQPYQPYRREEEEVRHRKGEMAGLSITLAIIFIATYWAFKTIPAVTQGYANNGRSKASLLNHSGVQSIGRSGSIGGVYYSDILQLQEMANNSDRVAFDRVYSAGITSGKLTSFRHGEPVYIVDLSISNKMVEIRRKGDVQRYWVNENAIEWSIDDR